MPDVASWNSTISTITIKIQDYIITGATALTTIYTPSPDCTDRWFQSSAGKDVYQCGQNEWGKPVDPQFKSCVPSSRDVPLYSPGLCPSGYGMATIAEYQSKGSRLGYGAFCCRSGMTYLGTDALCHSTFTTPQHVFVPVTIETDNDDIETPIYEISSTTKVTTLTTGTAWECPWAVEWEEQDLQLFPTAYATSLAKRINVFFTLSAAPASSSNLPQQTGFFQSVSPESASQQWAPQQTGFDAPFSSPLSSGAKAGISIGVLVGIAFLIGIASILVLRRRKRRTPLARMDRHDELITKTRW